MTKDVLLYERKKKTAIPSKKFRKLRGSFFVRQAKCI